jgi:hypothetical protein
MTTIFADYVAVAEAQKSIVTDVLKYTYALCEALRQNYIDYSIKSHQHAIKNNGIVDESYVPYHEECIENLKQGISDYEFTIESGRKYHKIIMNAGDSRSVHAFVDKKTGGLYKSASWKVPAKGERYNLMNDEHREWLFLNADWASGYLYAK